ncbi:MAG: Aspartate dehydrogenase [Devosia sp.]|uniref:aspartate dehydrogenase domain-containing protein n=1 Tax=Devosia sp. TaxID=1871048 RepID=UPI0026155FDB|nr:aspartate dehydrogenase domain-containing protein [Devosia sp.]MDB5529893.1 Aspartate dehydrogenase [Devosia sp.]
MIRVGVIGTGALGHAIASSLAAHSIPGVELTAIAGRPYSPRDIDALARSWDCQATTEPLTMPGSGANLVVEAAGADAAKQYAIPLLQAGCDVIIMSTGALADMEFVTELKRVAAAVSRRVYLPSGSIAGIDGILSAMESGPVAVRVTTRKRPEALAGAPHFTTSGIDVLAFERETTVFEGNAQEAVAGFPSNLNVALTLATAAGSFDRVRVRIIADPKAEFTTHQIEVVAKSGTMTVEMVNRPSASNPRSSWLAALSAIATIRRLASPLRIG